MKNQPFHVRIGFAVHGFMQTLRTEASFRIHVLATVAVVALLVITRPAAWWWAVMALTVIIVMAAELFNTAIEHLADHLHPQLHPRIRIVKDCAAAAVLMASVGALCVAAIFVYDVLLAQ